MLKLIFAITLNILSHPALDKTYSESKMLKVEFYLKCYSSHSLSISLKFMRCYRTHLADHRGTHYREYFKSAYATAKYHCLAFVCNLAEYLMLEKG